MRTSTYRQFGRKIERSPYSENASIIGEVDTSITGNVVLRVGRENDGRDGPWSQTEHIVLTPAEAVELANLLRRLVGGVDDRPAAERDPDDWDAYR